MNNLQNQKLKIYFILFSSPILLCAYKLKIELLQFNLEKNHDQINILEFNEYKK